MPFFAGHAAAVAEELRGELPLSAAAMSSWMPRSAGLPMLQLSLGRELNHWLAKCHHKGRAEEAPTVSEARMHFEEGLLATETGSEKSR
jgi:hypothetical protein